MVSITHAEGILELVIAEMETNMVWYLATFQVKMLDELRCNTIYAIGDDLKQIFIFWNKHNFKS